MAEGLKKEELDLTTNHDELKVELDEDLETRDEEIQIETNDPLNIDINPDDINDLTEEECDVVLVKLEVAIDKCEDTLNMIMDASFNEEEYAKTSAEHKRLKNLERLVQKHKRSIKQKTKEGGLFGNLPVWAFVLFIVCALFTIVPVNPYFPIELYLEYSDKIGGFINTLAGAYTFYFLYLGIFLITELVIFIILLIKGLKSKEKMATFKSYLVMFIINVLIDIPGLILFLNAALNH